MRKSPQPCAMLTPCLPVPMPNMKHACSFFWSCVCIPVPCDCRPLHALHCIVRLNTCVLRAHLLQEASRREEAMLDACRSARAQRRASEVGRPSPVRHHDDRRRRISEKAARETMCVKGSLDHWNHPEHLSAERTPNLRNATALSGAAPMLLFAHCLAPPM